MLSLTLPLVACVQESDSSDNECNRTVRELLSEHDHIRDRELRDGETESGRQNELASARGRLMMSARFCESLARSDKKRMQTVGKKMREHNQKLEAQLSRIFVGKATATDSMAKGEGSAEKGKKLIVDEKLAAGLLRIQDGVSVKRKCKRSDVVEARA
ncbi:hypothetical protein JG687_00001059 [Phytophthora cactorum]|nr:hypothetical protein Pcac1_g17965 [Phytophthora cactorum]KAG2842388.1 hypothetical protein PC111_g2740 [Phytophthora cactorum]KAG2925412.1 hypothetical protein PC114_g4134 [Phytophthora cactorum]KAG2940920.1 hypothetical protein PC115_g2266 [Phytophthora cactorum]KAG2951696.1 hypothetical protein PC117_g3387 [Phytophthora cactorum]